MSSKHFALLPLSAAIAAITVALPAPAGADADTCISGYVWREARQSDHVCVTPAVRSRTAQENANPTNNRSPNGGAYGPDTCASGFVWREAFDGDTICVTSDERAQTLADNAAAASRVAPQSNTPNQSPNQSSSGGNVVFEAFGPGSVYSIVTDPDTGPYVESPLPFKRSATVGPNVTMLQVVATGKDTNPGCRITLNGKVVAEKPVGGDAHCIYTTS
jgi:hypothetical protein